MTITCNNVLRELHVLTKTAEWIEIGLSLQRQTSLRLVPSGGTTTRVQSS